MKIAAFIKAALLASVGLAGASAAVAATDPNTAPSDLYIVVSDPTTSTSYIQDLGVTFSSLSSTSTFENPSGYTTNFSVTLPTGVNTSDPLVFSVFAADNSQPTNFINNSAILSIKGGTAAPTGLLNADISNNVLGPLNTWFDANLPGATTSGTQTGTAYWGSLESPGQSNTFSFGLSALAGLGGVTLSNTLNLIDYLEGGPGDQGTNPVSESFVGNATADGVFSFNGSLLTYTLAGPGGGGGAVPLPAAIWLLASGLLGFGAVSRRRSGSGGGNIAAT
jgi:hypothetical protein